jgi:hypothetical protein
VSLTLLVGAWRAFSRTTGTASVWYPHGSGANRATSDQFSRSVGPARMVQAESASTLAPLGAVLASAA